MHDSRTTITISATAPTRIDLAGGTIDIWPLYALHPGCTINLAIDLMARVNLRMTRGRRAHIVSLDQSTELRLDVSELPEMQSLPLIRELALQFWRDQRDGFRLETSCESPAGAGLGGSSALAVALCGAFSAGSTGTRLRADRLITIAKNAEARVLGIPTGIQDYHAALRGGLNVILMGAEGERATRLPTDPAAIAERLVLIYCGKSRSSGINNWKVMRDRIDGDATVTRALAAIAAASQAMAEALLCTSWEGFVRAMRRDWEARMDLSDGILTPELEKAIDVARPVAATWKVCGAGGGGCMVFACTPGRRERLRRRLEEAGFRILEFSPSRMGLRIARHKP